MVVKSARTERFASRPYRPVVTARTVDNAPAADRDCGDEGRYPCRLRPEGNGERIERRNPSSFLADGSVMQAPSPCLRHEKECDMRDYRDAKPMAQSLRKALAAIGLAVTHGQSLELIAQAFGLENWNTLCAKIDAERPSETQARTLYCSFCGKSQHDVQRLIAGPDVFICDECVGLCDGINLDGRLAKLIDEARVRAPDADPLAVAAEALSAYGDRQLAELRRSIADWLKQIVWQLAHAAARLEGTPSPGPWRPDETPQRPDEETARRRGWTRDPLAGKSRDEIAAHHVQLTSQGAKLRERLRLIEAVLAERGLAGEPGQGPKASA